MDRALVVLAVLAVVMALAALYRLRRAPGRGDAHGPAQVEPREVGLDDAAGGLGVVGFSSPYCLPCQRWEAALADRGVAWSKIDVADRGDLARRYDVRETPLVLAVELPNGRVVERFTGDPEPWQVARLTALARGDATYSAA